MCITIIAVLLLSSQPVLATSSATYMYNVNGQLAEMTNSSGTVEYQYDKNGNLLVRSNNKNLLSNSGFKISGDTAGEGAKGWNKYVGQGINGSYDLVTSSLDGGKAQKMTATGLPNSDGMNIWQNFFTEGGKTYTVKGMLNTANMQNAMFSVIIYFYDANNQIISAATPFSYAQSIDNWVAITGNFTSPANAVSARIHLHLSGTAANGQGTVIIDGVTVTLQDELP